MRDDELASEMRTGERGREVDRGAARTRRTDGGDGHRLVIRRRANGQPLANDETIRIPYGDTRRAGADTRRKRRAIRLGADTGDRDGLDAVAHAVDIQPDLVARRNIGDGGHLYVARAGWRVDRQKRLRARLAHGGDGGDLVSFHRCCDGGIGCAVADGELLADHEPRDTGDWHVRRARGDRDHRTVRQWLP